MDGDCYPDPDFFPEDAWRAEDGFLVEADKVEDNIEWWFNGHYSTRFYYGDAKTLLYDEESEVCLDTRAPFSSNYNNGSVGRHDYVGALADGRLLFYTFSNHQEEHLYGKIITREELMAYCASHGIDSSEVAHLLK